MSSAHQNSRESRQDEKFETYLLAANTAPRRGCTAPVHKTVRKPQCKAPAVHALVHDATEFLREMNPEPRKKFEELYPKSVYNGASTPQNSRI